MTAFLNALPEHGSQQPAPAVSLDVPACGAAHLLLPLKDADDIHYGLAYARELSQRPLVLEVSLLHVNPPGRHKGLFSSLFYDGLFDDIRADMLVDDAERRLSSFGIAHHSYIRSGEVVFSILDAAEMLNCSEIVLPSRSRNCWTAMFLPSTTKKLVQAARAIPVVTVDMQGRIASGSRDHHGRRR